MNLGRAPKIHALGHIHRNEEASGLGGRLEYVPHWCLRLCLVVSVAQTHTYTHTYTHTHEAQARTHTGTHTSMHARTHTRTLAHE